MFQPTPPSTGAVGKRLAAVDFLGNSNRIPTRTRHRLANSTPRSQPPPARTGPIAHRAPILPRSSPPWPVLRPRRTVGRLISHDPTVCAATAEAPPPPSPPPAPGPRATYVPILHTTPHRTVDWIGDLPISAQPQCPTCLHTPVHPVPVPAPGPRPIALSVLPLSFTQACRNGRMGVERQHLHLV